MGIDPGTYNMGLGLVSSIDDQINYLDSLVLSPKKNLPISRRLYEISRSLSDIIDKWQPDSIAIEQPFAGKNIKSAMAIGYAQAVAMICAETYSVPIHLYTPRQVKYAITNYGNASKEQVQDMIVSLLDYEDLSISLDASDALALAICHIYDREHSNQEYLD
jgi:crossover junction endodeoxyribonuclease RuvC